MRMLGRSEFCKLIDLPVEAFNALRRRGQLPAVPPSEMSDQIANQRGHSPLAVLLAIMSLKLVDDQDLSRNRAAEIAARGFIIAAPDHWSAICETSRQRGHSPDILFASIELSDLKPKPSRGPAVTVAVGTFAALADAYPQASGLIAVSVTRCAALMRQRAAAGKIDLGGFFDAGAR